MNWLTEIGAKIKQAVLDFVDTDNDGKVELSDLPALIGKGQQLVGLVEAGGLLMGASGKTKAKAADAFIDEAYETSRGDKQIHDVVAWSKSKELFREALYLRATALQKPLGPEDVQGKNMGEAAQTE
ncbi:MAG: hypothetical protein OXH56_01910 [Gemmatimonadetes bacterium]|nr:hypothetical protein [Gemmatimonadota bacterium]